MNKIDYREIEQGNILGLEENGMQITSDYTVLRDGIPVGTVIGNLSWFDGIPPIEPHYIDKVVYLGDYKWGFKQLRSVVDEFDTLSHNHKKQILQSYLNSKPQTVPK